LSFRHLSDSVKRMFCSFFPPVLQTRFYRCTAAFFFPPNALTAFVSFPTWRGVVSAHAPMRIDLSPSAAATSPVSAQRRLRSAAQLVLSPWRRSPPISPKTSWSRRY
jgi:hypothetical protein